MRFLFILKDYCIGVVSPTNIQNKNKNTKNTLGKKPETKTQNKPG
jgi:hypothetical protein